jgi:hypothetical protein
MPKLKVGGVAMIVEFELREQITRALAGHSSLDDLYSWLMSRSWNMHRDSAPAAVQLAGDVESLFFERSDGLRDDDSLRRELSDLLEPPATCDERHTHTGRALWDALDQAKGARRQPLLIRLTGRDQSA